MRNDNEENFNEEISWQNYKHDDSIDLDGVCRGGFWGPGPASEWFWPKNPQTMNL